MDDEGVVCGSALCGKDLLGRGRIEREGAEAIDGFGGEGDDAGLAEMGCGEIEGAAGRGGGHAQDGVEGDGGRVAGAEGGWATGTDAGEGEPQRAQEGRQHHLYAHVCIYV